MSTLKKEELYRRGYNFIVYLEGKQIPFQRVSGLADQGSFETLREGGRNSVVYSLKNQADFQRTVTLERGLLSDEMEMTSVSTGVPIPGRSLGIYAGAESEHQKSILSSGVRGK